MSESNVELVDRALAAFNVRDLDALAAASHEDLEFVSVLTELDGGTATFRGPGGWVRYFEMMDQTWEDWKIEDIRLTDAGDEGVVATCSIGGTGKLSGASADQTVGITYRLRDEKLWRIRSYLDPAEALAALGIEH